MKTQYSQEFKIEAVKRIERTGESAAKVAKELGIKSTTLYGWIERYKNSPVDPFPGSGKLSTEDEKVKRLEKELRELKEENEILKKAAAYFAKNQK